jgi:hypothetical protein
MSFNAAEENFHAGARDGIDAFLFWPGMGTVPATELVLRRLLPLAHRGLEQCGVDRSHRDRLLGVIERRCVVARNGSSWQVEAASRPGATLAGMLTEYRSLMHENVPVHDWPV